MLHPDMARELISQRSHEMQARAQEHRLARIVREAKRARRRGQAGGASFVPAVIPDYVEEIVGATAPGSRSHAPAGRTAA